MAVTPVLRHFQILTLGPLILDLPPFSQVPYPGTVSIHKQGASPVIGGSVLIIPGATKDISVRHPGDLRGDPVDGDIVQVSWMSSHILKVVAVSPADPRSSPTTGVVSLKNIWSQDITVVDADRLVITSRLPLIFDDPTGQVPRPNNTFITDATTGQGGCYVGEYRFDYVVTGTQLAPYVGIDHEGSFVMRSR